MGKIRRRCRAYWRTEKGELVGDREMAQFGEMPRSSESEGESHALDMGEAMVEYHFWTLVVVIVFTHIWARCFSRSQEGERGRSSIRGRNTAAFEAQCVRDRALQVFVFSSLSLLPGREN